MPKQRDPPSPSKPVPYSWWFLTGGVGVPPRSQAGFHRLASERKAAHRVKVTAEQERDKAGKARKDALAKLEQEHGPSGLVGRMLWRLRGGGESETQKEGEKEREGENKGAQRRRQQRKRLGRKELMEKYGPDSGVKAGRATRAMATSGNVSRPQADAHAVGSGDQAPADDVAANDTEAVDAGAAAADSNTPEDGVGNENTAE
ncbi:hypothetical protein PG997_004088 [Apiospora hydei]|uniref:Uncharacterized protein n=1 Tax=Apiospora hydei TaxID=1337664 RepID=A0ABR1X150_9PEZI